MKTIRFGLIGCGGMGELHALNSKYVPGMEVSAFADVDKTRAETFLRNFGGRYATEDPRKVIEDSELDAVLIQTGPKTHPALGIAAAQCGKHIFMEKPLALRIEDALPLRDAIRRARVKFLIGVCNRLAPAVIRAKNLLPDPWISYCQCAHSVTHQAVHNLDLILHKFHESSLQTVYAAGGKYYDEPYDVDVPADSFVATLKFANGSQSCYIQHGQALNALMSKYSFQLFGKNRCVFLAKRFKECHLSTSLAGNDLSNVFQGPDFSDSTPGDVAAHVKNVRGPHGYMGHYDELVELCAAIREDREPEMSIDHGINVLAAEKAILESITSGTIIDYPKFLKKWGLTQPIERR